MQGRWRSGPETAESGADAIGAGRLGSGQGRRVAAPEVVSCPLILPPVPTGTSGGAAGQHGDNLREDCEPHARFSGRVRMVRVEWQRVGDRPGQVVWPDVSGGSWTC